MDFADQITQFSKKVEKMKNSIQTEEATKTSLIMPFFAMLGYDVFDPSEFVPEFTADVGIKKGEKVDYAIMINDNPEILIEAKWCGDDLSKHGSQLFRYFGTTKAKFAILTNGITYNFYTDLDEPNKMDEKPFLSINILDLKDTQIAELKKFGKSVFDKSTICDTAEELKYSNEFKNKFSKELQDPSEEIIRLFLTNIYPGRITQTVFERFKPILKKALNAHINELMNDKIQAALNGANEQENYTPEVEPNMPCGNDSEVETTEEELEAYFLIKNLLKDIVPADDITYRDTINYINVLYKDNGRKWICRLILTPNTKRLIIPDENKNEIKIPLENLYDLEKYKSEFIEVLQRYI